jgi:hypothetical protein
MTMLYVAGPMTGLPAFNYPAFNSAARRLRVLGYDVLNPVDVEKHNTAGEQQPWDWYMRHALRMVLEADGLALLENWQDSRGATLEVHVAETLGLPVQPLLWWVDEALAARRDEARP